VTDRIPRAGLPTCPGIPVNIHMGVIMTAVILINVVLASLVVIGIVGSLALSIVGDAPLCTVRRLTRA
jgi:hypothetical protein